MQWHMSGPLRCNHPGMAILRAWTCFLGYGPKVLEEHFDWFFRITNFRCSNESNWNCLYPKADYAPTVVNPDFETHREDPCLQKVRAYYFHIPGCLLILICNIFDGIDFIVTGSLLLPACNTVNTIKFIGRLRSNPNTLSLWCIGKPILVVFFFNFSFLSVMPNLWKTLPAMLTIETLGRRPSSSISANICEKERSH